MSEIKNGSLRKGSLGSLKVDSHASKSDARKSSLPNMTRQQSTGISRYERQPKRRESVLPTEKEKEEEKSPEPANMFIIVKYADNQSLLVNPMCSVVNLLSSIKSRTGHAENKDMLLDLSDETGLIQDLEVHGRDYATKHLCSHGTYILMQKQLLDENEDAHISQALQQYNYIPLLERISEQYPNFKVHLSESQKKKLKPLKNLQKSPSPAGKMGTSKINSSLAPSGGKNFSGRPPRSSSRGKPRA